MRIKFRLFRYRYYLTIRRNYCGAGYECLVPREGEDWLRGGDCRDGRLWQLPIVLADIVARDFRLGHWAIRP